jgi:long-chain acyl-CoA synthetase
MTKPWLRLYGDLPATLENGPDTMIALFRSAVARGPDQEALRYFDASWTWRALDQETDTLARSFAALGVGAGDRVGIILQNVPQNAMAAIAAWKLGAIPVPGNPMYRAAELAKIFGDYGPRCLVGHDDHAAVLLEALDTAKLRDVPVIAVSARARLTRFDERVLPQPVQRPGGTLDFEAEIASHAQGPALPVVPVSGADTGLILYTSGTTGEPKGAMISQSSLAFDARCSALWFGIDAESRILALAPMFHITGFVLHMSVAIAAGCSHALIYRFETGVVADACREYRPTFTIAAITAFNALMHYPGASKADFASFDRVGSGGAPIAPALRQAILDKLGFAVSPVYGMTETAATTHAVPFGADVPMDAGSGALAVGVPVSSTEAMIADEHGNALPIGEAGEIWMRGPQIMQGYLNKPEESARTLPDGWMRSGDIGFMDAQGWFYIVDRMKDMINASGFKVWPREVEDVLYKHPAVREAAVVGFADPYRGESVRAFVSLADGQTAEATDIIAHCRSNLAAYKVPREIVFLADLPKTPTGKIQRVALRHQDLPGAES